MSTILVGAALALSASGADARNSAYAGDKVNCHIFAHTHDDPGWLKTPEQYYQGLNNSVQNAGVKYILTSVTERLRKVPDFKFIYAEMWFFQRWYEEQTEIVRADVRKFIQEGRLELINAGWVMHDSATPLYVSMIDQMTLGHRFVREEFDVAPRTGWVIDPFGHSGTTAATFAEMGFDSLHLGRIHYQDRAQRTADKSLEMMWRGSPSLGRSASLLTGAMLSGLYFSPSNDACSTAGAEDQCINYCFDTMCKSYKNGRFIDDEASEEYNVPRMVDGFVEACMRHADAARGLHTHLELGSDFLWSDADMFGDSLDKLIKAVNADGRVNVFYSTPYEYAQAKSTEQLAGAASKAPVKADAAGVMYPTKVDDFFPYADAEHAYWTGYFSSRPTLKRLERQASAQLQAARQLAAATRMPVGSDIRALAEEDGLMLHHDAITGTQKQHVAYDYVRRLDHGLTRGEEATQSMLSRVAYALPHDGTGTGVSAGATEKDVYRRMAEVHAPPAARLRGDKSLAARAEAPEAELRHELSQCRLAMNETVCATTTDVEQGEIAVAVYNSLPRERTTQVTVLLSSPHAAVLDEDMKPVTAQVVPTAPAPKPSHDVDTPAPYALIFDAEGVPALAAARYTVIVGKTAESVVTASGASSAEISSVERLTLASKAAPVIVEQGALRMVLSGETGRLERLERTDESLGLRMDIDLAYYVGYGSPGSIPDETVSEEGRELHAQALRMTSEELKVPAFVRGDLKTELQPSGAYIFRNAPKDSPLPIPAGDVTAVEIVRGRLVSEARLTFSSWASLTLRLRAGSDLLEVEWTVGPVPVKEDRLGKEVIVKVRTPEVDNRGIMYTDSNGRDFFKRRRNFQPTWDLHVTEPVSANFYPMNAAAFMRDEDQDVQLSLLTDRSQAVGSVEDGSLEVLVHRRLLMDDLRGAWEPLNETDSGVGVFHQRFTPARRYGEGIPVRGSLHVQLSRTADAMRRLRPAMDALFMQPLVAFGTGKGAAALAATTRAAPSMLGYDLPINVHLVSLQPWTPARAGAGPLPSRGRSVLVRVAHQFGAGEDAELSQTATVDLAALLAPLGNVAGVTEMTLSASMTLAERLETMLPFISEDGADSREDARAAARDLGPASDYRNIKLSPMKIRTFVVELA